MRLTLADQLHQEYYRLESLAELHVLRFEAPLRSQLTHGHNALHTLL